MPLKEKRKGKKEKGERKKKSSKRKKMEEAEDESDKDTSLVEVQDTSTSVADLKEEPSMPEQKTADVDLNDFDFWLSETPSSASKKSEEVKECEVNATVTSREQVEKEGKPKKKGKKTKVCIY